MFLQTGEKILQSSALAFGHIIHVAPCYEAL